MEVCSYFLSPSCFDYLLQHLIEVQFYSFLFPLLLDFEFPFNLINNKPGLQLPWIALELAHSFRGLGRH